MCQARKSRDRGFGNEAVASIVADLLNKESIMDKFLYNRWRHAGLQRPEKMTSRRFNNYKKMLKMKIFAKDWHEPVQINLGPNVEDITTGRKPAYLGQVNFFSS